jgi:hypothetical protein
VHAECNDWFHQSPNTSKRTRNFQIEKTESGDPKTPDKRNQVFCCFYDDASSTMDNDAGSGLSLAYPEAFIWSSKDYEANSGVNRCNNDCHIID